MHLLRRLKAPTPGVSARFRSRRDAIYLFRDSLSTCISYYLYLTVFYKKPLLFREKQFIIIDTYMEVWTRGPGASE
jgi:hypothetical protein